jgi:protease I
LEIVKHFANAGKPIAAICHGPQILSAAGVLVGKECCCYPAVEYEVSAGGGKYVAPNEQFNSACVSGNLVTAAAWPAHPAWMQAFVALLGTKIEL